MEMNQKKKLENFTRNLKKTSYNYSNSPHKQRPKRNKTHKQMAKKMQENSNATITCCIYCHDDNRYMITAVYLHIGIPFPFCC